MEFYEQGDTRVDSSVSKRKCQQASSFGEKSIILEETYAIDSVMQVVTNGIANSNLYKIQTEDLEIPILKLAHKILKQGNLGNAEYKERAKIVSKISSDHPGLSKAMQIRQVQTVNTNCNAAKLSAWLGVRCSSCLRQ